MQSLNLIRRHLHLNFLERRFASRIIQIVNLFVFYILVNKNNGEQFHETDVKKIKECFK